MPRVHFVKVFTKNPKYGNLAGVVLNAENLDSKRMQKIAAKVGASETGFVLPSGKADFKLRWFTPNTEVGLCVHATIAACAVLQEQKQIHSRKISIETQNAIFQIRFLNDGIFVRIQGYRFQKNTIRAGDLSKYLGLEKQQLSGTPVIIKIFQDRELMVPVKT